MRAKNKVKRPLIIWKKLKAQFALRILHANMLWNWINDFLRAASVRSPMVKDTTPSKMKMIPYEMETIYWQKS